MPLERPSFLSSPLVILACVEDVFLNFSLLNLVTHSLESMVALALSSSLHASNSSIYGSIKLNPCCLTPSVLTATKISQNTTRKNSSRSRRLTVFAVTEGSSKEKEEESIPSWARPDSDEPPPWARDEASQSASQQSFQIPFFVYLLASAITAIAAIGSVFEYLNQKPVFGVLSSDSVFYAPLLGFFAFTGIPTSAFLWFKSVQAANKEAEEQDRRDGFL